MSPAAGLREAWLARWPEALALWSRYTRLSPPHWCKDDKEARQEGLSGSFAMIRFSDQAIVINLAGVAEHRLEDFPLEIMGHEIGHHILVPANLADHGRLLARMRRALPTLEDEAPMVANLYADLLINDRLQREHGLDMAGVYRRLRTDAQGESRLWTLYLRIYEILWALARGTLAGSIPEPAIEGDARLGARIVRVYARDWLTGGSRFAALCLPYLIADRSAGQQAQKAYSPWRDSGVADESDIPEGLAEEDDGELDTRHPADDPALNGDSEARPPEVGDNGITKGSDEPIGGRQTARRYRDPIAYTDLLKSLGSTLSVQEIAIRYYRERALPWLIRFPRKIAPRAAEPLPEGHSPWEFGAPLETIDWVESVVRSPHVIPGMTTLERTWGESPGDDPRHEPIDLYVGIDCSGSMPNPQMQMSFPVLGGAIVALSALRAGARVMACLSGEPGRAVATDGFVRRERDVLELLTGYLGSGYTFGLVRLDDMRTHLRPERRPVHILILTDMDIFSGLDTGDGQRTGWQIAETALREAGGGGTMVLNISDEKRWRSGIDRLRKNGWNVRILADWQQLPDFARDFSRRTWATEAAQ